MNVDPITFAVIKSGLDAIADDMAYTVVRIARSEIVKDVMDFSAALCAADGQMVAQAKTIAQHLGAIPEAMQAVLARFDGDLHDGDVVIMNDPYHGGMHLPDIFMFVPIFHGGKRRAFAVVICHHTDVGGRVPGSNASDSTEIYQEGLRIPPLKLYERGTLNTTLEALIRINVRVPDRVWGDLSAQFAAAQVGRRALEKLMQRYGADEVDAYMQELLDYAERMTRAEIRTWPRGTWHFTDHIDDDGFSDAPIPIRVAITVRDDGSLLVDYAGSSPQVRGAINATLSFTHSLTYLSVRCVLAKEVPNNVGMFRCVSVRVPEASILNPVMPGPCAARALTGYRVFDTMLGALAQIVPDKVPAAGEGGNSVICISGLRPNRQPFIIVDMICGAWGGRPNKDGLEAVTNASQNLSNMPVEIMEAEHPVRIEEYAFVPDSCGAGRYRGGVGVRRSYRILADEALLQMRTDRVKHRPYGLAGGEPGGPSRNAMEVDGERRLLPGKITTRVGRGTLIVHEQAGAGGFGDPLDRDAAAILEDCLDGKISAAFAERHFGVVIARGTVDEAATRHLRASRRAAPLPGAVPDGR
ncbi:5-oxoprolinase (ATP-hydrolyzing) [Methylobacterium sp. 4-46]|uniref:hydantoinase B/oxoprolinase family protein n=1 Tax=unclassified Methylobacterium TaxID=2615210 RepID=UPI000152DA96|nr:MULTISPECIES: hydantoinase B/oxoprolinase family protein [Methylobacterium]ACA19940.1 5-oxoprolinase (ATP-hydrolyzing) [Methylobacterium sp. 4-46]WFT79126.1 hydantoinase B/oxoprolinase family protein [Methylobacterium nodulans]